MQIPHYTRVRTHTLLFPWQSATTDKTVTRCSRAYTHRSFYYMPKFTHPLVRRVSAAKLLFPFFQTSACARTYYTEYGRRVLSLIPRVYVRVDRYLNSIFKWLWPRVWLAFFVGRVRAHFFLPPLMVFRVALGNVDRDWCAIEWFRTMPRIVLDGKLFLEKI